MYSIVCEFIHLNLGTRETSNPASMMNGAPFCRRAPHIILCKMFPIFVNLHNVNSSISVRSHLAVNFNLSPVISKPADWARSASLEGKL